MAGVDKVLTSTVTDDMGDEPSRRLRWEAAPSAAPQDTPCYDLISSHSGRHRGSDSRAAQYDWGLARQRIDR